MENVMEQQKDKAKGLRVSYLQEESIKRATSILRRWEKTIEEVLRLQQILFIDQYING